MRHKERRIRSFVLVAVGAVVGTLLVALPVQAAGQPPLDVRVVNTTAEPVPVAVEGTPIVKVDTTAQPVAVAVQGTATVKLDTTTPIVVRNADEPARSAVATVDVILIAAGADFGQSALYTVPAGKRLVLQAETAKSFLDAGITDLIAIVAATGSSAFVPQREYGQFAGQGYVWAGNAGALVYADPGTTVHATVKLSAPATGGARIEVGFSGYLVDL